MASDAYENITSISLKKKEFRQTYTKTRTQCIRTHIIILYNVLSIENRSFSFQTVWNCGLIRIYFDIYIDEIPSHSLNYGVLMIFCFISRNRRFNRVLTSAFVIIMFRLFVYLSIFLLTVTFLIWPRFIVTFLSVRCQFDYWLDVYTCIKKSWYVGDVIELCAFSETKAT